MLQNRFAILLFAAGLLLSGCRSYVMHDRTTLKTALDSHKTQLKLQREVLKERIIKRLHLLKKEGKTTYDILILSGGGQYGAFGVGVLQGWNKLEGSKRRPTFDMVTGVSTGSLIAPFAFIGNDHSMEDIGRLYEQANEEFAILKGMLFFLPWRESFFDPKGLFSTLEREVREDIVHGVHDADGDHRLLLMATTNLDLGVMAVWFVNHEIKQHPQPKKRLHDIMRASCSIPAVFPPHPIDGFLHVDGGTSEQMFMLNDVIRDVVNAQKQDPTIPKLTFRIWVIINGKISPGAVSTEPQWVEVAGRCIKILTHESMALELRRLEVFSDYMNATAPERFEFHYIAIPEETELPASENLFEHKLMHRLMELGRELGGRDSWNSHSIAPEELVPSLVDDKDNREEPKGKD